MKKNIVLLFILSSITALDAQEKKEEKFIESNNYILTSNAGILMQKYYRNTKATINSYKKELGEDRVNMMLNFNQKEYYKAIKYDQSRYFQSSPEVKISEIVYETDLVSKLES